MIEEPAPAQLLSDLNDLERRLVEAARTGASVQPQPGDDPKRVVRAELIAELLLGRRGEVALSGLSLSSARIVGRLDLRGIHAVAGLRIRYCVFEHVLQMEQATLPFVTLSGNRLPGLSANGLRLVGDLRLLDERFYDDVMLRGARIGGDLHLNSVVIPIGRLVADRLRVEGDVSTHQVMVYSEHPTGVVRLAGATIEGRLDLSGVRFKADSASGVVLDLAGTAVGRTVVLPTELRCPEVDNLTCARAWQVRLTDFSFTSLDPALGWRRWLHLIRCHTDTYTPSAYQKLAALERTAGHDGTARRILIAQQDDLRRRAPDEFGGGLSRLLHWVWGALAGYGYRARRTAAALLLALTVAGALGWCAGQVVTRAGHHAAERVAPPGSKAGDPGTPTGPTGEPCSLVELVGLGLDRGLPLGMTGLRARCDLDTTSRTGQAFVVAIWGIQLAVWGLATLALAGYTNLVRKTS